MMTNIVGILLDSLRPTYYHSASQLKYMDHLWRHMKGSKGVPNNSIILKPFGEAAQPNGIVHNSTSKEKTNKVVVIEAITNTITLNDIVFLPT
jgi:hypothetical protein